MAFAVNVMDDVGWWLDGVNGLIVDVMDDVDGVDGFASAGRGGCAEASAVNVMDDGGR